MSRKLQAKLEVLNLINSHKDVLFGKFSDSVNAVDKFAKWNEVAVKAREVEVIKATQSGQHLREVTWQNWRKRAMVSSSIFHILHEFLRNWHEQL